MKHKQVIVYILIYFIWRKEEKKIKKKFFFLYIKKSLYHGNSNFLIEKIIEKRELLRN